MLAQARIQSCAFSDMRSLLPGRSTQAPDWLTSRKRCRASTAAAPVRLGTGDPDRYLVNESWI